MDQYKHNFTHLLPWFQKIGNCIGNTTSDRIASKWTHVSRVFFVLLETFSSISALISFPICCQIAKVGSWNSPPNTTRSPNYVEYFTNWFHSFNYACESHSC
jgi:hypothetical protein